ncbi:MAG: hypothetical protein JJT94_13655 [Bernardetiaceae bacterium]|nr:hypothetical protein [Bernardetiaceae bacterium]
MKTVVLQSDNEVDIAFLIELAQRLGVACSIVSSDSEGLAAQHHHDDESDENLETLLEGVGLNKEITAVNYEEFLNSPLKVETLDNTQDISTVLQEVGGIWEDDKSETLEDLLNQLTP